MKERYVNNKLVLDPEYPTPATLAPQTSDPGRSQDDPAPLSPPESARPSPHSDSEEPETRETQTSDPGRSQDDPAPLSPPESARPSPHSDSEEPETRETPTHSDRSSQTLNTEDSERRKEPGYTDRSSHTFVSEEPDTRQVPGNSSNQLSNSSGSGELGSRETPDSTDQLINKVPAKARANDETQPQPRLRTAPGMGERHGDGRNKDDGWEMAGIDRHRTSEEPFREAANEGGEGWDCYGCLEFVTGVIWRWATALLGWCTEMVTGRG